MEEFYSDDPDAPGRMYTRRGGFVDGIENFDADFFGISPREALRIDPQQRVLLEVAWEALEDAGSLPETLADSNTGVFAGITLSDYGEILAVRGQRIPGCLLPDRLFAQLRPGPHRLSFSGLHGPALAIDTACSSSLVAVDTACRSLRTGQCDLALAGGTNALLTPDAFVTTARPACCPWTAAARRLTPPPTASRGAKGTGVVVLKRLADALADGDRILAVILGSAVNQDGKSSGLTVPNRHAQEAVIR